MLKLVGWFYCLVGVVAVVSYFAAGQPDMHVNEWREKAPKTSESCITIEYDNKKHRHILDHAWDAIKDGAPDRLHIDRDGAKENREESTDDLPLWSKVPLSKRRHYNPNTGKFNNSRVYRYATVPHDRDEWPVAASREGGEEADVRYVLSTENKSAGSELGRQLRGYSNGTCFKYEDRP